MLRIPLALRAYPTRRAFSCSYSADKPFFSPFMATLLVGGTFASSILAAVAGQGVQTRRQLDRMELEIRALKETGVFKGQKGASSK